MDIIKANKIIKTYGGCEGSNSTRALNGLNLKMAKGEFTAVMGPSGSGKTTLLNILGGLDKPTSGQVQIKGQSIDNMSKNDLTIFRSQNIGFVFQDFNLLDSLTIKENIILPLVINEEYQNMEDKVRDLMDYLGIDELADKYPYHVSGGQQQLTAIARALIKAPQIVMADEPSGNLDSKTSRKIMSIFSKINIERNTSILMVTHDPLAASYSKRIFFIKDGREYTELVKEKNQSDFFDRILNYLAVLEGEQDEI